jgi:protein gp37
MAENSKIEWTDHTFNPWIGCTKVSPACDHCYAEAWNKRFKGDNWGPHADRRRTKTWGNPLKWNKMAEANNTRYRVFCASLADVFDNHKSVLPEWRDDLWKLIKSTPHLDWLLLTKRPQNIEKYLPKDWHDGYKNVWLGTTVENQVEANRRIPYLLSISCAKRFLSCEPLLGPIDLSYIDDGLHDGVNLTFNALDGMAHDGHDSISGIFSNPDAIIDWVITGGESGKDHRPDNIEWYRSLRDQCEEHNTPFLFKQWGGKNQKVIKTMGRKLDGVLHDGYPI